MKKYQIIYADPPWQYKRKGKYCAGRYYSTMTVDEITQLPIKKLADDNSLLFIWTTNSFLPDTFKIIEAWGFQYKTCITWDKERYGLGYWAWGQTEHCLLCSRGKHKRIVPPLCKTIIKEKKTRHSSKPKAMYELIERFPQKNRLELFARFKRQGWDVWGNEVESDIDLIV